MPSNAAIRFFSTMEDLGYLRALSIDRRLLPKSRLQKQILLHSYLTGVVAAWDAYIKAVIIEYMALIADPNDLRYSQLHGQISRMIESTLRKSNTPNFENSRNIFINLISYDPIGDCVWTDRGLSAVATRDRLNEILQVRHSFAHGFPIPSFGWNRTQSGQVRLSKSVIDDCLAFFRFIVSKYDRGISNCLRLNHGIISGW